MSTQVVSQILGESFLDYNMGHVSYLYETKYMFSSIFILKNLTYSMPDGNLPNRASINIYHIRGAMLIPPASPLINLKK
jgi:hypothetical protein